MTYPNDSAIEQEASTLSKEANAILLVGHWGLEDGLMDVGIKLLVLGAGVNALKTVLLESVDEDSVGHLEAIIQGNKVLVLVDQPLFGNGGQGAVEVVNRLDQVASKALDGEVLSGLDLALSALLQVVEVGD